MKFNRVLALTSVAALATVGTAWADDEESTTSSSSRAGTSATSPTASSTDKEAAKFLKEASKSNQMEVEMGKLAVSKAQNAELKSFAQHLQQDHSQAQTKLTTLAQQHGVQLDPVDKSDKEQERLTKLSGAEFDREFTLTALKHHQKDIAKYEKAVQKLDAADVKQFAQEQLPKLRQHLSHAAQVAQTIGIDSTTISSFTKPAADAVGGSTSTGETDDAFTSTREAGAKNQKGHGGDSLKEGQSSSSSTTR
jgi:putative membrane protein